jgi:hypothetical protein
VKLSEFILVFAAIPVAAQSTQQHGFRLGSSIAFLTQTPDLQEPARGGAFEFENVEALKAMMENQESARLEWLANYDGADFPVAKNPDGSVTPLVRAQKPSAVFETWAGQKSTDYVESAKTGFTGIERLREKTILRRFVRDDIRKIYVSYAATVEALPDGSYRVSFGPSSDDLPMDLRGKADWKALSPAKYPVPQIVTDEDSIPLELYSTGLSRKVVDFIHAGRPDRMVMRKEVAHDSYADDAELSVTQPRLRVNGVAQDAGATPETMRGSDLWIYVPGHGRFVLSQHAHPDLGFESAGEVAGSSLTFSAADGNVFRIDTAERIASGSGSYTVYVLPDPGWLPADTQDRTRVMFGAAIY